MMPSEAEKHMAELIDEIGFLEQQLQRKDDEMKDMKAASRDRENTVLEALESVLTYVTVVEQGVFLPSLAEFSSYVVRNQRRSNAVQQVASSLRQQAQQPKLAALLTMLQVPNTIADTLTVRKVESLWERPNVQVDEAYVMLCLLLAHRENLEQLLGRATSRLAKLSPATELSAMPSASTTARAVLEAQQDRAAAVQRVSVLEERLASEKASLSSAIESLKLALGQSTEQCRELQAENSRLLEDVNTLRRNSATASAAPPPEYATKVAAFEMTISALNDELGGVEGRISQLEKRHDSQKRALTDELDSLRKQYDEERKECDAFVQRMMQEMELLWKENEDLRSRLPGPIPSPSENWRRVR